jgi:enterochelin esterase family protein
VTFRVLAPKASEVLVRGDWPANPPTPPMTKDEKGVWAVTIGPLPADLYNYTFSVDGLSIADPRNKMVKLGARSGPNSVVEVPGERSAFLAIRNVPHGAVHIHHYFSKPVNGMRRLHV